MTEDGTWADENDWNVSAEELSDDSDAESVAPNQRANSEAAVSPSDVHVSLHRT